jgi:acyl carrier protein
MPETIDRVRKVIAASTSKHIDDVGATDTLGELCLDSLERIEAECAIEDEFDVHFALSEGFEMSDTVGDVAKRIDAMLQRNAA